ncbi:MAG: DUF4199 domain-containing protein [Adhaeribacter sp.]
MYEHSVIREGLKYGLGCALIGFGALLILYFTGTNPFGSNLALTLFTLPPAIILGLYQFKKYIDPNIGFRKAFSLGVLISATAALLSAGLVLGLAKVAGRPALERHIAEMKAVLEDPTAKAKTLEIAGEENYVLALKNIEQITALDLAADDFYKKLGIGFLISLVGATFFRK